MRQSCLFENAVPPSTWRLRKTAETFLVGGWNPDMIQTWYIPNKTTALLLLRPKQ